MASLHPEAPSTSNTNTHGPIILPPPRPISGLQHRYNQYRPSINQSSNPHQQHLPSSPPYRPALTLSSRSPTSSSFIPTQSAGSISHWANQDPFDYFVDPRPRARAGLEHWYHHRPLPFAPEPPSSLAAARQLRQSTSGISARNPPAARNSYSSTTSSASSTDTDPRPQTSTSRTMPAQTRKRRATNEALESVTSDSSVPSTNRSNKRRATQTTTAAASSTQQQPSASSSWRPPRVKTPAAAASRPKRETRETPITFDSDIDEEEEEIIDLVDKDEVPPLEDDKPKEPKEDNTVKLGSFQCVICMDDVTGLTVTHCGHLFCSECLHVALHIEATKKVCPICRQKIETNPASGKFTAKSRGFWPLELKLMTTKRSGKRAAK